MTERFCRLGAVAVALAAAVGIALPAVHQGVRAQPPSREPCTIPPPPDRWETYTDGRATDAYASVVDPADPCRIFLVTNPGSTIERSGDGGRSWATAYAAPARSASSSRFDLLAAPGHGVVYAGDRTGGLGFVRSVDGGNSWLTSPDLLGRAVVTFAVAPGDAAVVYALVAAADAGAAVASTTVWVTRDSGERWVQTSLPTLSGTQYFLAVDPRAPGHVVAYVVGAPGGHLLVEGHDFGRTAAPPRPQSHEDLTRLEMVHLAEGPRGLRLYKAWFTTPDFRVHASDDMGATWTEVFHTDSFRTVSLGPAGRSDGRRFLLLARANFNDRTELSAFFTRDAFATVERANDVPVLSRTNFVSVIQSDAAGTVYADVAVQCTEDVPACRGSNSAYHWHTYRFSPPDAADTFSLPGAGPEVDACDRPGVCGGRVVEHHRCSVIPGQPTSSDDKSGSLAFDGRWLYYTRTDETGPAPYQAVIRRVDPRTCRETGRLLVDFDPASYRNAWERAYNRSSRRHLIPERHPAADALAYDAVHRQLWFAIGTIDAGTRSNTERVDEPLPVWSVPVDAWPDGHDARATARLRFTRSRCGEFDGGIAYLAYDRTDDTLWTCDFQRPGHVGPSGESLRTCLHPVFRGYGIGRKAWSVASWAAADDGRLVIVQREDDGDRTVVWFATGRCEEERRYTAPQPPAHVPYRLAEQVACDAVTYGPASRARPPTPENDLVGDLLGRPPEAPTAVLWWRAGPLFVAYRIPDRTCPVSTTLRVLDTPATTPASPAPACASLTVVGPGVPAQGREVAFVVGGRAVGQATTGDDGVACTTASGLEPGDHGVEALFAGDLSYLPAAASGVLTVLSPPSGSAPPATPPPPARPEPPAPPVRPVPPVPLVLPAVQPAPATPPPAQPIVQPQPITQAAAASEKEKAPSLAMAAEAGEVEEPELAADGASETGYAMSAVLSRNERQERARAVATAMMPFVAASGAALALARRHRAPALAVRTRRRR